MALKREKESASDDMTIITRSALLKSMCFSTVEFLKSQGLCHRPGHNDVHHSERFKVPLSSKVGVHRCSQLSEHSQILELKGIPELFEGVSERWASRLYRDIEYLLTSDDGRTQRDHYYCLRNSVGNFTNVQPKPFEIPH
jgi:hypothetical protein